MHSMTETRPKFEQMQLERQSGLTLVKNALTPSLQHLLFLTPYVQNTNIYHSSHTT